MPPTIPTFSGRYVFYLKPDVNLAKRAIAHAQRLGKSAPFTVTDPFLDLFHAVFREIPLDAIDRILDQLQPLVHRVGLDLDELTKGHYHTAALGVHQEIRWHAMRAPGLPKSDPLVAAHLRCCLDASRWINPNWHRHRIALAKGMKSLDPQDVARVIDHGSYDVKEEWDPHIVLVSADKQHQFPSFTKKDDQAGGIVEVGFAELNLKGLELAHTVSTRT